jgi:ribosomal protein L16 Arg81 hydroxylase
MKDFASLIAPITPDEFKERYWQKAPVLRRRQKHTNTYDSLFKIEQIDEVMRSAAPNATDFDYFAAGALVPQAEFTGAGNFLKWNALLGHYAAGGTIHVSNLQKYVATLGTFCKSLQEYFFADAEADLWTTRDNTFKPYLHFDRHDIFVLQIHGTKRWRVFQPLALAEGRPSSALNWDEVGEPLYDVELHPGDLLYLPEFTPHAVTTLVPHSVHVGLGVHPFTWRQVLECALEAIATIPSPLQRTAPIELLRPSRNDATPLREALREAVVQSLDQLDFESVKAKIYDRFVANITSEDDGHFSRQILHASPLTGSTSIVRRQHAQGRAFMTPDNRSCASYAGGGVVTGPPEILADLQYVLASTAPFTAADLPGQLDMPSRLVLLQRLVDAGLCSAVLERPLALRHSAAS